MITVQNRKLIDISKLAKLYSTDDFRVIKQIDSSRDESDKRFAFILSFDNVSELVIKACKNDFTSEEKVFMLAENTKSPCHFAKKSATIFRNIKIMPTRFGVYLFKRERNLSQFILSYIKLYFKPI